MWGGLGVSRPRGLRPVCSQSDSRGLAFSSQMQEALEAKERECQRLTDGQREVSASASPGAQILRSHTF